ncbi:MAG: response regulator transcription factor [Bacillota bacterium]|nr:response regulator transcription factor [Bacillota bacterium]
MLEDNNYSVDVAFDGENGQYMAESGIYDLILLDRMLPIKEGLKVLKAFRKNGIMAPVLLLTAKDTVDDKVEGLDAGADDYLVKPFSSKELLARIRALSRRQSDHLQSDKLKVGTLELDMNRCEVIDINGKIKLTYKEAQLLELFIRKKGQVISKEYILDKVWGMSSFVELNNIEIYIHYLRKKLNPDSCHIQIETIRNVGYCLREDLNV